MRGERLGSRHDLGRRCPPAGIPRPVRFGGHTEQGGECRLRLAQRDPALTQRARLHDVTPCHRHWPPASAGLVLGVLQSANLWGRPVTFFACTFAPGAQAVGTISEFSRKMARPAGFEPATLGLEGRGSRFAFSGLSRTLISACPPPRHEEMTPLGVRSVPSGGDRGEARAGRQSRPRFPSSGAVRVFGHYAIAAENGEAEPCLIRAGLCLRGALRALGLESERRVFVVVLSRSSEGLRFDPEQDKELSRHIVMLGV